MNNYQSKINIFLNNKTPNLEKENEYKNKVRIIFEGYAYLSKLTTNKEQSKEIQIKSGHQITKKGKYKIRFISKQAKEYKINIKLKKTNYLLLLLPIIILILLIMAININKEINYESKNINTLKLLHIFYPEEKTEFVAQYVFQIDAKGYKNSNFSKIRLADTVNEKTLVDNLIAPGTSGSFDIIIKTTGGNLDIDYFVEVQEETTSPKNLVFSIKGNNKTYNSFSQLAKEKLVGHISKDWVKKITIEWKWSYDEGIEEDVQDTKDGKNLQDYSFKLRAVGKNNE